MNLNKYSYQCYCNYLQNQPPLTSENSQNPPQYAMYTPPPHMWYMYPSSNVEPPISGSSQNAQIYSLPSTFYHLKHML